MDRKEINRILTPKKHYLVVGMILFIVSLLSFYCMSYLLIAERHPRAADYHQLIQEGSDNKNDYVRITITGISKFVETNDGESYYFVSDKDGNNYIVRLTDDTFKTIAALLEVARSDFSYPISGYIFNDTRDLKKVALSSFKNYNSNVMLTEDNFTQYLGSTYMDETLVPHTSHSAIFLGISVVIDTIVIVLLVKYFDHRKKLKKISNTYGLDNIESEMLKPVTLAYEKQRVFLTDNYLISTQNGPMILNYEDIVWSYVKKMYYHSFPLGMGLLTATRKNKIIEVGSSLRDKEILCEIAKKIQEKNPDIIIGYTKANKAVYKNMFAESRHHHKHE